MPQARPDSEQITAALAAATAAADNARKTRLRYGRRRTPSRDSALESVKARCEAAAKPLRSWIGMVAFGGISQDDEIAMKDAIADLRYERRQITKMLGPRRGGPRD